MAALHESGEGEEDGVPKKAPPQLSWSLELVSSQTHDTKNKALSYDETCNSQEFWSTSLISSRLIDYQDASEQSLRDQPELKL